MNDNESQPQETNDAFKQHLKKISNILLDQPNNSSPDNSEENLDKQVNWYESISLLIKNCWRMIANYFANYWHKLTGDEQKWLCVFGILLFLAIVTGSFAKHYTNKTGRTFTVIFLFLACINLLFLMAMQTRASLENSIQNRINIFAKLENRANKDWNKVQKLCDLPQASLKVFEEQINLYLNKVEVRHQALSNLFPIIGFGAIFLLINTFNIPVQPTNINSLFSTVTVTLIVTLITSFLKFVFDMDNQAYTSNFERYLALLKQAQEISSKTESK